MTTKAMNGPFENQTVNSFLLFLTSQVHGNPLLAPFASAIDGRIMKIKETYSECMNETIDKVDQTLQKQLQELKKFTVDTLANSQTLANAVPLANLRSQVHSWKPETIVIDCKKYWHKNTYIQGKVHSEMPKELADLKNHPHAMGQIFEKDRIRILSKEIDESFIKIQIFGNFPHASLSNCKHTLTLKSEGLDNLKECMGKLKNLDSNSGSPISQLSVEINPSEITINMLSFMISDCYLHPGINTFTLFCPVPQGMVGGYLCKQEQDTFIFEVNVENGFEKLEENELDQIKKQVLELQETQLQAAKQLEFSKKLPNCTVQ